MCTKNEVKFEVEAANLSEELYHANRTIEQQAEQMKDLEWKNGDKQIRIDSLTTQLASAEKLNAEQAEQITALTDEVVDREQDYSDIQAKNTKLQAELADYKNSLKIAEGEYEQLGREYEELQAENHELLLADTKNTEIVERLMKEAEGVSEDAWDSLKRKVQQLEAQLIDANLDIIRLEKRNESMHEDYDALVEVISDQDREITKLKKSREYNQHEIARLEGVVTKLAHGRMPPSINHIASKFSG